MRKNRRLLILTAVLLAVFLSGCAGSEQHEVDLTYHDGFAVITYADLDWMQEKAISLDVYVTGTIVGISAYNTVVIVDADDGHWSVEVGSEWDLSSYLGSQCEVFGFCTGRISAQLGTPVINLDHENCRMVLSDGVVLQTGDLGASG